LCLISTQKQLRSRSRRRTPVPVPYLRCVFKRMSLKAKLEAVIYAAEEPVTLAQFASLFAEEALAWKAEQEALRAESAAEAVIESADSSRELADLLAVADGHPEEALGVEEPGEEHTSGAKAHAPATNDDAGAEAPAYPVMSGATQSGAPDTPETGSGALDMPAPEAKSAEAEGAEAAEAKSESVPDPEQEAKRAQRQREREVREILRGILDELIAEYAADSRGIEIREIAGGFRMGTKPEIHDAVRAFVKSLKPPMKLSLPALETLAVIAYKQPVTAPEVGEIRGVDSAGVLGSLMSRKLIATAGRKQVIGRPMLYKTTKEFLLRFGLKDLNELPSMEEFEKMAAMELSEESLDEESSESKEPVPESGDLFAESETATVPVAGTAEIKTDEPQAESDVAEAETAVTIPTAEPSEEAAAAQAPVERLDAEEIEASR
jgi:segregation and condensation protein B